MDRLGTPGSLHAILAKWLKKAKLRDGSHNVVFTRDGSFYYRGFQLASVKENRIRLRWPASVKNKSPWTDEEILIADPNLFKNLRKAFRTAMTSINAVSINIWPK